MTNSLSQRLAQHVKHTHTSHPSYNRALFLSLRADITQALNDGWSIKSIWQLLTHEGKVTLSYQAFLGYVRRLITPTTVKTNLASPLAPNNPDLDVDPLPTPKPSPSPPHLTRTDFKKEDLF